MKLIFRGEQAKIFAELATSLGYSPTDLVYTLAKNLHELLNHTIDAQDAQEINYGREKGKRSDC